MPNKPDLKLVAERVTPVLTPEEMKMAIQAERAGREKRALERIAQVLQEERCEIWPVMIIRAGNVDGRIEVKAKD